MRKIAILFFLLFCYLRADILIDGDITGDTVTTKTDNFVTSNLIIKTYKDIDMDDNDTIALPDGAFGHGIVFISNDTNQEGGTFGFNDNNEELFGGTTNFVTTNVDNKLVLTHDIATVIIKNTLGNNYMLSMTIWYFIIP